MTSLSASYKGFVILAQAELIGSGGPRVCADERHYVPLAIVAGASGIDDRLGPNVPQALRLFRARGQESMRDPYQAMTTAIRYARELVDALTAGLALDNVPETGEFEWAGARWRWDWLNTAKFSAWKRRLSPESNP